MLMKVQSKNYNTITYHENISDIFVHMDRHSIDCDCVTCHIANEKWSTPLKKTDGWLVYIIDIQQKDGVIRTIDCGPGDEVYLLNDKGQTVDKIYVPIN